MYLFLIWEHQINIWRMTGNLSSYALTSEKLPNSLPDGRLPAWKRFGTNVHLETNRRRASNVHQPAVVKLIMVALIMWATTCKSLFHWRLYIPSVLLMAPWAHPLTPVGLLHLSGWETNGAGGCHSWSTPWPAALVRNLPGDNGSAV